MVQVTGTTVHMCLQVPPALAVAGGRLIERASGAPAELHGVNYFGWNTDTPNFDGLWAYNDDEIPGNDSVGNAGALQLLNISWWGKRRVANDFAAVVHRMGLLGFNAVRVQFTFENLNRDLPAGTEPEFYPCLVSAAAGSEAASGMHARVCSRCVLLFEFHG